MQSIGDCGSINKILMTECLKQKKILSEIIKIQEAGAFAVELEIVPSKVATEISKAVEIFLIGMGSGVDCFYLSWGHERQKSKRNWTRRRSLVCGVLN